MEPGRESDWKLVRHLKEWTWSVLSNYEEGSGVTEVDFV